MQPNDADNDDTKFISMEAWQRNVMEIDGARSSMSIVIGIATGILNCEGLYGLITYLVMYFMLDLAILSKMNFDSMKYANQRTIIFFVGDLAKHALSFILFWTLTYALIYIY